MRSQLGTIVITHENNFFEWIRSGENFRAIINFRFCQAFVILSHLTFPEEISLEMAESQIQLFFHPLRMPSNFIFS